MSFDHKAFAFEWSAFQRELAPSLAQALLTNSSGELENFIDSNLESCSNPYEGTPLDADWRLALESGDMQEVADFALTKYYDPSADHGLGGSWTALEASIPPTARAALLGSPFGVPGGTVFDPGGMGSYLQSPEEAPASLATLRELRAPGITDFVAFLAAVIAGSKGVYVTF